MSFNGTSLTAPATGRADPPGPITVSNLSLFLSVETDVEVIRDITSLSRGGFQLPILYVYCRRDTYTGTTPAITVKITPDMGYMVKRLIFSLFNGTEQFETSYDHDNRAGAKLASYVTQLDSVNRQQYTIQCATASADDWRLHQRLCKGTAIQNRDIYQYNWFHCEDFSELSTTRERELLPINRDNLVSGLPIVGPHGSERIWTLSGTTTNATYFHYTFIVAYKTLIVSPDGQVWVKNAPA